MTHRTSPKFWNLYDRLPQEVRDLADKNYELLEADPTHPSLNFKKIGSLWSVRVGAYYRALGLDKGDEVYWFWIGSHTVYDRLIQNA